MPQPYPTPNITSLTSLFQYVNLITDNWYVVGFIILYPMALFILFRKKDLRVSDSLVLSIFLTLVVGSFVWSANLLAGKILGLLIAALAFAILYGVVDN